ncbi:T9SS type A sorting domain-containing protein [Pedobacter glucosidilyticus]|uniref:T9SS type A sorting domain-containing protein n=1 Tax=Pedobacter glucosidilyticus TaxID=1122941 RepID=UPI0026EA5E06|nr:T9SS type A sorting domain-containing protein [Pedobacter glucosidilyticus]
MRKIVLCMLLTATSFIAAAQNSVRNWEKTAIVAGTNPIPVNGYSWFQTTTTTNNIASCAYNPVTDRLYVANRGIDIYIINPATGEQIGTLSKVGITQGTFGFQKVRVTSTGEIFAASLRTSTANGNTFVYYWANETANPVQLGNASTGITLNSERTGDSFAVTGSGQNVVMYFGGNPSIVAPATHSVQIVNKNGPGITDFVKVNNISLTANSARSGIAPVTTGITSDLWISGVTVAKRLITSTGVETKVVVSTRLGPSASDPSIPVGTYTPTTAGSISDKFSALEYFEIGAKKFLATTGANDNPFTGEGLILHIYDVTDVNAIKLIESTQLTNTYYANTNATADIAMKRVVNGNGSVAMTFFQLITNNGLASYTLNFAADGTLPVSLTSFTAGLSNGVSKLSWTTASESNNSGFDVQRSTDGVEFASIGFVASKAVQGNSSSVINYSYEDKTVPAGTQYYRLKQIDLNGDVEYSTIKVVNNVLNELAVKIYPNPAQNTLTLSTPLSLKGASYTVYNMVGQDFIKGKADELTNIDVSTLAPGIYFIKVISLQNEVQSLKFVKQ